MYKLLIVDDEEFEREALARFIEWEKLGVELIGTAWNGVEALEIINETVPDIIITDINMPVINGYELIKEAKKISSEIQFVIISGYGEFSYTSKAIAEGIRHYILKPFDDEMVIKTIKEVKLEIETSHAEKEQMVRQREELKKQTNIVNKLMSRAKDQVFRNVLLKREQIEDDYISFCEEFMKKDLYVFLLAVRNTGKGFDYLEQFVIENVLVETLGSPENILSTVIQDDIIFMIPADLLADIKPAIDCAITEFMRISTGDLRAVASKIGEVQEISELYQQLKGLFLLNKSKMDEKFVYFGMYNESQKQSIDLFDYSKLNSLKDYNEILIELYISYIKLKNANYTMVQKNDICNTALSILFTEDFKEKDKISENSEWLLIEKMFRFILSKRKLINVNDKNDSRKQNILIAIYQNIENMELSIQYLTNEVLFMNEDYFGRVFTKLFEKKFSTFLAETRIELAKRMIEYEPDIKISILAELVGYSPDGQYFSKTFKKIAGVTPIEHRNAIRENCIKNTKN